MGKDSPKPPPPPDPAATAAAQTKTNIASAIAQANLNRINQYTPQGSLTYTQDKNADGTPAVNEDGTPRYSQTQTLSPDEQKKYDQANQVALALGGLADSNIDRVKQTQATPFTYDGMTAMRDGAHGGPVQTDLNYSGLTKLPGTDDFSADARRVADSVYGQAASRLDPRFQQSDSDMKATLAAKGISENSDAYRREIDNASRAKNDAYNQAQYSAQQAGSDEQSRIFGLAMQSRQQGQNEVDAQGSFHNTAQSQAFNQDAANVAMANQARQAQIEQAAYLRNMPINDIAALLGTGPGVQSPDFNPVSQVGVAAPDYAGMVYKSFDAKNSQQQQQAAARSQMLGQIFGTVGTAATMMSDRRFKANIRRIGTLANGLATYAFNYIGDKAQQFGVMAQEVLDVIPDAVSHGADGFMRVDYGKVY